LTGLSPSARIGNILYFAAAVNAMLDVRFAALVWQDKEDGFRSRASEPAICD